jgi:hypothetical protein
MTSIPPYQWTPYEHAGVNGLCAGFTVGNPVLLSFLSARLTNRFLISPDPIPSIRMTPVENVIHA